MTKNTINRDWLEDDEDFDDDDDEQDYEDV